MKLMKYYQKYEEKFKKLPILIIKTGLHSKHRMLNRYHKQFWDNIFENLDNLENLLI